ncbi:MAG: DUF262 domain-containing protein [Bacteroidales bacterium]|nr:DUF262 domain-containing protein [Bacteroidales bacterium]
MAKDIEPKLKLISDYLRINKDERFVIPEYQRGYSWNIVQCDKLWQDIEAFIESDKKEPYFFGTIIADCSETDRISLIDGQQRTTTFILLLKALLLRLQDVYQEIKKDVDSVALAKAIEGKINKIIDILYKTDDESRYEVMLDWNAVKDVVVLENKSINELYKNDLQVICEAPSFSTAEKDCARIPRKQKDNKYTNFFRNFKFFYNKLGGYKESKLNTFAKTFLGECQIIEIRSWQTEQAITMFNSLNSTGLPLSDADIISAQLYSNAGEDKVRYMKLWEDLKKSADDLSVRKIVDIDSILQQYMYIRRATEREYIKEGSQPDVTTPGLRRYYTIDKKELLKDPFELCEQFNKIAQIWDTIKDYPIVKLLLKFNENAKIYLVSYLFRYNPNDITKDTVQGIAECLLRLFTILELVDAGYSSSNFKTFLFGENVKLVDACFSMEDIEKDFNEHIGRKWENRDELKKSLMEYDKNILVFLNEYLYAKKHDLSFKFSENVNIEHIMPASGHNITSIQQDAGIEDVTEFKSVVNQLGNKILLEEDINKSIGNEWFKTKKQKSIMDKAGYKDSTYPIALALVGYPSDVWTKEDIETATSIAAKRILDFIYGLSSRE